MNIRKVIGIMSIELNGSWIEKIFTTLMYSFIFVYTWNSTKDFEFRSILIGSMGMYIFFSSFSIIFKEAISKNNKIFKEVEQIVASLPVNKKERILGRIFNSGFILYMMIIPYITMYIFPPSNPQWIGVRGGLTLLIVYVVVWSIIRNISKYNRKYKILSRILGIIFVALFVLNFFSIMSDSWRDIIVYLYDNKISAIIGSTYIGIILGIFTVIFFYYFNFTYILRGIKNNRWQIR